MTQDLPTHRRLNIHLHLDPWRDNKMRPEHIEPKFQPGVTRTLRLSEFQVQQTDLSATEIAWSEWVIGADAMLNAAKDLADGMPDHEVHYYLSGRAALPLFAYFGIRLSKWAMVTVFNYYEGDWYEVPIRPATNPFDPFFTTVRTVKGLEDVGKVIVFVSTEHAMDFEKMRAYMREHQHPIVGVVELSTGGERRILNAITAGAATAQLDLAMQQLRRYFPQHTGVVLFVAGPTQLAVMAGRAINPHIHGTVEFPNHASTAYVPGLRYARDGEHEVLRILALGASPIDKPRLDLEAEFRGVKEMLQEALVSPHLELSIAVAVTVDDLMDELNRVDPHIIHLSAHGSTAGDIGLVDRHNKLQTVPSEGIVRALRTAGRSIRLVVVNACHSAALAEQLRPYFDYTIGVERPLRDSTAIAFSRGFYRAVSLGRDAKNALEQGQAQVVADGHPGADNIKGFPREGFNPAGWIPLRRKRA